MPYDDDNVFAKILRGEIPCDKIFEDELVLAFHDIHAQAPVHALVVPKGRYVDFADFIAAAGPEAVVGFYQAVARVAEMLELGRSGYRLIANSGPDSHQEVPHFHVHILGGRALGPMLTQPAA